MDTMLVENPEKGLREYNIEEFQFRNGCLPFEKQWMI